MHVFLIKEYFQFLLFPTSHFYVSISMLWMELNVGGICYWVIEFKSLSWGWQNINLWFVPKFVLGRRLFPFRKIIWEEPGGKVHFHFSSVTITRDLHEGQNQGSREKGWNTLKIKGEVIGPPQEIHWKAERRRERIVCHWEGGIAFWAVTSHLDILHQFLRALFC